MRCGIDFGTSNTVLAFMDDATKKAGLVPLENDSFSIPTAIFYPKGNLSPLFGREALETALGGGEGRLVRSLKRALGTSLMEQPLLVNGVRTSFANIVGRFLSHIRQRAEACLGVPVQDVTLGRPVHFQTNDPQADMRAEQQLRKIALDCGFRNIDFRYEPVAAALAHERRLNGEKLALVVDIGGGTSDFSVIRLNRTYARGRDRRQDILANTGMRIGGNDCDKALSLHTAMPLLGMGTHYGSKNLEMPVLVYHDLSEWVRINNCYTPAHLKMVREICVESHAPQRLHLLERVLEEQ